MLYFWLLRVQSSGRHTFASADLSASRRSVSLSLAAIAHASRPFSSREDTQEPQGEEREKKGGILATLKTIDSSGGQIRAIETSDDSNDDDRTRQQQASVRVRECDTLYRSGPRGSGDRSFMLLEIERRN